jgi:hypothetical protein
VVLLCHREGHLRKGNGKRNVANTVACVGSDYLAVLFD